MSLFADYADFFNIVQNALTPPPLNNVKKTAKSVKWDIPRGNVIFGGSRETPPPYLGLRNF